MSALLLVVVCVNLAGLVLVRGMTRRGELAARLALGASRARILRLLLLEHIVLAHARINEEPRSYVYMPFEQMYVSGMTLHVRAASPSFALLEHMRSRVEALDPNLSILEARMLTDQTRIAFAPYDVSARVLGIVGLVAIALAALGIYGLLAYIVKQRAHEVGIRMAVGARRSEIVRMFLGVGLRLSAAGAAIGCAVALVATRLMAPLLFGVSATDALSFALAAGVVLLVALLSSLIPAWWGARIDPIVALRRT
jgi:ABC-type antimicrobial peptide transport system permease subunit